MRRSAAEVRSDFLEFFRERGHTIEPGSPVVPYEDPTLLFTNAGMNQFKDVFLGTGTRSYKRAANSQPCIRAGGKHNDLDDVGQDTYHHTFFEMLGNWSFGDYFKKEAIEWAWELLTDVWGLEKDRLHATYFGGAKGPRGQGAKGSVGVPPAHELAPDLETRDLWAAVTDIDPTHIHPGSMKDNFWEMGDVGPCGPCSEIHIDLTPDKSGIGLVNAGDPRVIEIWNLVFIQFAASWLPGGDARMVEWDKSPQKKRGERFSKICREELLAKCRRLAPLRAKHVDTGMGLERVCALLQGKSSNYDTDVFTPIFQAIRDITGAPPYAGTLPEEPRTSVRAESDAPDAPRGLKPAAPQRAAHDQRQLMIDVSYRVIADHARCLTFALNDGAVPDREGRGYVLRRILRRAVRYGWQYFNMHEPFLYKLVPTVVDTLGGAFPQLKQKPDEVAAIIREEEESFDRTLDRGISLFEFAAFDAVRHAEVRSDLIDEIEIYDRNKNVAQVRQVLAPGKPLLVERPRRLKVCIQDSNHQLFKKYLRSAPEIGGREAFILHDTYGFPIDLTQIMAEEKGLTVDLPEYERLMERAREHARAGSTVLMKAILHFGKFVDAYPTTHDDPKYTDYTGQLSGTVCGLIREGESESFFESVTVLKAKEPGAVLLDRTSFYAEAGGQIGDSGFIRGDSFQFEVKETHKVSDRVLHCGTVVDGEIRIGHTGKLEVDPARGSTMQNHTATHVMNWALREVLGEHVQQKGSLVDPDKTRFDFSHPKPMTAEEIERVEQLVNERIAQNLTVYDQPVPQERALKIQGARAVFGEKYPDVVRVLSIGTLVEELVRNPDNPEWRGVSIELCGGTHCKSTGEIEHFAIVSEEAVAKGIRRVVGISGRAAKLACDRGTALVKEADELRRTDRLETGPTSQPRRVGTAHQQGAPSLPGVGDGCDADKPDLATQVAELQQAVAEATLRVVDRIKLRDAIAELQQIVKQHQKRETAAARNVIANQVAELLKDAPKVGDTTVVVAELPGLPIDQLKTGADMIKQKCKSAAVLFAVWADRPSEPEAHPSEPEAQARDRAGAPSLPGVEDGRDSEDARVSKKDQPAAKGKALLLAAMTPDLIKRGLKAGDLIKQVAPLVDGRGGGPPTMAQAGGRAPERISDALAAGRKWIEEKLV